MFITISCSASSWISFNRSAAISSVGLGGTSGGRFSLLEERRAERRDRAEGRLLVDVAFWMGLGGTSEEGECGVFVGFCSKSGRVCERVRGFLSGDRMTGLGSNFCRRPERRSSLTRLPA